MLHQYRCQRCGYHYGPAELGFDPGQLFPDCNDRARCDRHIATQKRDKEATGK